jgi:tRNA-specific 2-thiouridylase
VSGGVDSAVSAWLLKEQGYHVSALFMVNWAEDEQSYCTAAEDFQSARAVCEELGILLHRVDFSAEYRTRVFERFLADYAAGKTPNPDVLCNREVKFQPFREHALRLGADFVATGHYARIEQSADGPRLLRSADDNKDQTYFLATVARQNFDRVLFPVGGLTKPMVRDIARRAGLPNHTRRDSTGVCFIGEREFRAFLEHYLQPRPGAIEDDDGRIVGQHRGVAYYTLGQRRGLSIGGQRNAQEAPWYIVAKDVGRNVLIVSQNPDHPRLMAISLTAAPFHWLRRPDAVPAQLTARIRHRQALQACTLREMSGDGIAVDFAEPQRAAVSGQYLVLYDGTECLGGGEIDAVTTLA